jgi:hypothetical protein
MLSKSRSVNAAVLTIVAISLVGGSFVYYATVWGPTVYSDSVYYLGSADNLVHGRGFGLYWGDNNFRPFAGDPPFYPYVVALLQLAGLEVVSAARWVGILSFFILVAGSGWLTFDLTRSPGLAIGTSLFLFFPALRASLNASSEVVFYPAALLSCLLLLRYLKTIHLFDLILAALLAAAAFLTRYVGVALLFVSVMALLFLSNVSWRKRILDGFVYSLVVCIPMLIWLGWGYLHTQTLGERTLHLPDIASFAIKFRLALAEVIWKWTALLPDSASYEMQKWWMLALLLILVVAAAWALWLSLNKSAIGIIWLWSGFFALYALVYLLVYFGAYITTLPTPDLIFRMFEPFLLASGLSLLGLAALASQGHHPKWISLATVIGLALLFVVPMIPGNYNNLVSMHRDGNGYSGRAWRQSPVIEMLKELPAGTQIITNQPDAVLFLTGRPAHWIPEIVAQKPAESFLRFGDGGTYQENIFRDKGGALVLFPGVYQQMQAIYYDQTDARLKSMLDGLTVYRQFDDYAGLYYYPNR